MFKIIHEIRKKRFTHAVLLKNSFFSALAVFLAGVKIRVGYCREARSFLLTEKLSPPKNPDGTFKPISMVDYYLAAASWLGADTDERYLEIPVDENCSRLIEELLPEAARNRPVIILVPGGGFGPSKCWPAERFALAADSLIDKYNASVYISVAPNGPELKIAEKICRTSKNNIINLQDKFKDIGKLKAFFKLADLVITNDTGPRHIATALGRKVVTLLGPNEPVWADTGFDEEIQIIGKADCAPCLKPVCIQQQHLCMESITVDMVLDAAETLLGKN